MSAQLGVDQAQRLQRAEARWLAQCADRLRRAHLDQPSYADRRARSETTETSR